MMNDNSQFSIGRGAFAGERLYCGSVTEGQVTRFRFADYIEESDLGSVAGGCVETFAGSVDIFVHSQPDGNSELSDEDKDLETPSLDYTCIQFDEISVSPVTGEVHGLDCWAITEGNLDKPVFTKIDVGIEG